MKKTVSIAAVCASLALTACATTEKVAVSQLGDEALTCEQIRAQDKRVDEVMAEGDHNKGASGANVAAVLLFWPAALGNYMDADKAQQLASKRKSTLADLYRAKACSAKPSA